MKNKKSTSANDIDRNNCNSHDKDEEETTAATTTNNNTAAVESGDSVPSESSSHDQTASETPSRATAVSTSFSLSKSASTSAVISKEKSPTEDGETNSSSVTAHKPVDLADTCTPSEQATQPILEAAA